MGTFGMWEFTNDRTATIAAYARIVRGGSDACSCNGCRNFVAARDKVYPSEFIALLCSLGIDSRKDGEVYHNAQLAPGRHDYGGWFHFVGTLQKTGDFPVVPMGPGISAWLRNKTAPALPCLDGMPLVEVEFHADSVPWVLKEAECT
jgi:hypothetical protein